MGAAPNQHMTNKWLKVMLIPCKVGLVAVLLVMGFVINSAIIGFVSGGILSLQTRNIVAAGATIVEVLLLFIWDIRRSHRQRREALNAPKIEEPVVLAFSLTRLQRIANPPERMFFALTGIAFVVLGLYAIIATAVEGVMDHRIFVLFIGLLTMLMGYRFFGGPARSLGQSIFGREYINIVRIDEECVAFGVDVPAAKVSRQALGVSRGLFGTLILRHPAGYSLVLSKKAISFKDLKLLIGHVDPHLFMTDKL